MGCILLTIALINLVRADDLILPSTSDILDFITAGGMAREGQEHQFTTTDALIRRAGFQSEVHTVVTEDGYILRLTRIKTIKPGPPVLMLHGLFEASDSWLQRGRTEDLAFILADHGFDVWLADLRGNVFSSKHRYLKVSQPEFWNFSFHEVAIYDLPAFINKILTYSLYRKVFYVGHSMGTTIFFILTSVKPEFNDYINTSIMLSPVVFGVKKLRSTIIGQALNEVDLIEGILKTARVYVVLTRNIATQAIIKTFCSPNPLQFLCLNLVGDIFGDNRRNINKTLIADYLISASSGASVKQIIHYSQLFKTGEFKQFDYGKKKNLQVYLQPTPLFYPLNQVTAPVVLFYSNNDNYLDEQAVQKIQNTIPNMIYKEALPYYSHIDYMIGTDAPKILYNKILKLFNGVIP